ncbi:unnamed protein product, partial [Mesorhabditis belari]|uniref:Calcineurin-like phosphoesterase domain-containing protein n=1 Tax=Mesorhabditis belari TaxID=2138241 RepID=A0AAF3EA47_9BILA
MRKKFRRIFLSYRFVLTLIVISILWSEWLAVKFQALFWEKINGKSDCSSVLVVADPQLIGYRNEPWWVGPIARWDSDRYLQMGFNRALQHSQPDLIMYLGDLIDEGLTGSLDEFEMSAKRFHQIFKTTGSEQLLFIPGDNDIGGETEYVREDLMQKFKQLFPSYLNLSKINLHATDLHFMNVFNSELLLEYSPKTVLNQRIIVSHAPIMKAWNNVLEMVSNMNSTLILSAHDHTAWMYTKERNGLTWQSTAIRWDHVWSGFIGVDHPLIEIQIPTCSYRMGVANMAYGHLVLCPVDGRTMQASFTLLPLPRRYSQIMIYIVLLTWV